MGKKGQYGPDCTQCGAPEVAKGLCNACYKRKQYEAKRAQLPLCPHNQHGRHSWSVSGICLACKVVKPRGW